MDNSEMPLLSNHDLSTADVEHILRPQFLGCQMCKRILKTIGSYRFHIRKKA